ncbi:hypothetical protein TNCV_798721 [Trichonephila clavipes]|nr:hypothetical protein TNCV_798721 [Trichonephila clavipes]
MPTSQENAQVFFHSQGLTVLCIRNSGFTLTNGVVSYAMDRQCPQELFKFLHYLNVGTICVTDQHSKQTFKDIQASWSSSSPFKRAPVMLLNSNGRELGNVRFVIRPHVIVGLPCKACVPFCINPSIPFFTRDWLLMTPPTCCFNVYKKRLVSTLPISRRFNLVHNGPN